MEATNTGVDYAPLELQLSIWSEWSRGYGRGLGMAPESTIGRVIRLGPSAAAVHGVVQQPPEPMPELVARVDNAVLAIPHRGWQLVVIDQWVRRIDRDRQLAARLGVPVPTMRAWRVHAYCFLMGRLGLERK